MRVGNVNILKVKDRTGSEQVLRLTQRQQRFAEAYVRTGAAKESAVEAGYKPENAQISAQKCLIHKEVAIYIKHLREKVEDENDISMKEIINNLTEQIRIDFKDLYDEENNLKPIREIKSNITRNIKNITETKKKLKGGQEVTTRKVELYDKQVAIEKLIKILGGYEIDNQQKAAIDYSKLSNEALLEIADASMN